MRVLAPEWAPKPKKNDIFSTTHTHRNEKTEYVVVKTPYISTPPYPQFLDEITQKLKRKELDFPRVFKSRKSQQILVYKLTSLHSPRRPILCSRVLKLKVCERNVTKFQIFYMIQKIEKVFERGGITQ